MSNALKVFEKYIGTQSLQSHSLKTNITDTNQIIGSLQSIDKTLRNSLDVLEDLAQVEKMIQDCRFAGKSLFDQELTIPALQKRFFIHDLTPILRENQAQARDYIQEKRAEIASLLDGIYTYLEEDGTQTGSSMTSALNPPLLS